MSTSARTACWRGEDRDDTVSQLVACLDISDIAQKPDDLYASDCMKSGMDHDKIMAASSIVKLVTLDPRGGIFRQTDMFAAVRKKLKDCGIRRRKSIGLFRAMQIRNPGYGRFRPPFPGPPLDEPRPPPRTFRKINVKLLVQ